MKYKKPRKLDILGAVAHKRPTYTKPTQMTKKKQDFWLPTHKQEYLYFIQYIVRSTIIPLYK